MAYRRSKPELVLVKLNYVDATLKAEKRSDYFWNLPLIHERYAVLQKDDFLNINKYGKDNKGQTSLLSPPPSAMPVDDTVAQRPLIPITKKNEYYIRAIIYYCKSKNVPLLLIVPPIFRYNYKSPYFNYVSKIAKDCGTAYLDMNQHKNELVLVREDVYYDNSHLLITGARKVSEYLAQYIKTNYNMPDHRGVVGYESWDRFAAVRENTYLRSITSNDLYFQELARDGQRVVAIPHLLADSASPELQSVLDALGALPHETLESGSLNLDGATLSVAEASGSCALLLNGNSVAQISTPGVILAVWDQYNGELADVTIFSADNAYALRRL